MKSSSELIKDKDAWKRKYDREKKNEEWEYIVNSYVRWMKMLEIGKRLNHQKTIDYCITYMNEAEVKFPQLKRLFS